MTALRGYVVVFGLLFLTTLFVGFLVWDAVIPHGIFAGHGFMICLFLGVDLVWLSLFWLVRVNDVNNSYGEGS